MGIISKKYTTIKKTNKIIIYKIIVTPLKIFINDIASTMDDLIKITNQITKLSDLENIALQNAFKIHNQILISGQTTENIDFSTENYADIRTCFLPKQNFSNLTENAPPIMSHDFT